MTRRSFVRNISAAFIALALLGAGTFAPRPAAGTGIEQSIRDLLSRECINLDQDRMYGLITERLSGPLAAGNTQDLLRIMEGVVKRTDFDALNEEKAVEIIGLVHGSFLKGAPLEQLDDLFDVAYARTITVDQLAAGAKALQDLHRSEVPREMAEEFVYHAIEDEWDPSAVPVLTRGLIYGADRGLSPDKVALIIMLDMKNGELKAKNPDQLVLDAVKLVREKEPRKWRPLTAAEREHGEKQKRLAVLERQQQQIQDDLQQKERAFVQAQRELKELREYPADRAPVVDGDRLNRDLEQLIRKLQRDISRYQEQRGSIAAELETTRRAVEQRQAVKDRERQQQRDRDLSRTQQTIAAKGRQGRLDRERLLASVNSYLGTPYRFGGDSAQGIDCSAFTRRVYRGQGVELPRTSREQARTSGAVDYNGLRTGDLVFFDTSINGVISHVGVYLGNGTFAHASSSKGVTKSSIKERYYVKRFARGGRIFAD